MTRESAKELLEAFWVKFNNQPAPPKIGVTAEESGTYADFALINVGGLKTDGTDGVNDLSYLILDVIEEIFASLGLALLGPVRGRHKPF